MNTIESLSPETLHSLIDTIRLQKTSEKETSVPESERHFGLIGGNKLRTSIPSLQTVKDRFDYDPVTGKFTWRIDKGPKRKGAIAGAVCSNGYRYIGIDKDRYVAGHLAWYVHYGVWPDRIVDHINGNRSDDSIENLRLVNKQENAINNKAKRKADYGVYAARSGFRVQFYTGGKNVSYGQGFTYKEACEIALRIRKELGL